MVLLGGLLLPSAAFASLSSEVHAGKSLSASLGSGHLPCSELTADDFDSIGEYAMAPYLGSGEAHAAMNRHMTLTMGPAGERRMHIALGHRYSGCAGGPASGWVGAMGTMMSGRSGGSGGFGTMTGGRPYGRRNPGRGAMMGSPLDGDGGIGALGVVLIAVCAAALGAGIVVLAQQRNRPGSDAPA